MSDESQISATVSASTREKLDRFTERHGLKKNYVIEQALLYFMEARRELPDEALIPTRIVLDDDSFDRVAQLIENPRPPTDALRKLMRGQRG
jgi:uncharacterized protein (DUF1778 family)